MAGGCLVGKLLHWARRITALDSLPQAASSNLAELAVQAHVAPATSVSDELNLRDCALGASSEPGHGTNLGISGCQRSLDEFQTVYLANRSSVRRSGCPSKFRQGRPEFGSEPTALNRVIDERNFRSSGVRGCQD